MDVNVKKRKKDLILTLTTIQICENPGWVISY